MLRVCMERLMPAAGTPEEHGLGDCRHSCQRRFCEVEYGQLACRMPELSCHALSCDPWSCCRKCKQAHLCHHQTTELPGRPQSCAISDTSMTAARTLHYQCRRQCQWSATWGLTSNWGWKLDGPDTPVLPSLHTMPIQEEVQRLPVIVDLVAVVHDVQARTSQTCC